MPRRPPWQSVAALLLLAALAAAADPELRLRISASGLAEGSQDAGSWRVAVHRPCERWHVELKGGLGAPPGGGIAITVRLRSLDPNPARLEAVVQRARPPWTGLARYPAVAGPAATELRFGAVIPADPAAGPWELALQLGGDPQRVAIEAVRAEPLPAGAEPPRPVYSYAGREPDAPWRAAAAARIAGLRTAATTLRVVDARGRPAAGVAVRARLLRPAFLFGCAIDSDWFADGAGDGDRARYGREFTRLFTAATIENGLKWPAWEDAGRRRSALATLAWLEARGLAVRGHCLLWPGPERLPARVARLLAAGDAAAVAAAAREHAAGIVGALRGRCAHWDVVNEAVQHREVERLCGTGALAACFAAAREADPGARLFINENRLFEHHAAPFADLLARLAAAGAAIDGIGEQAHIERQPPGIPTLLSRLDALAAGGRRLVISEYDFVSDDEALQADFLADLLTAAYSHPAVDGVVLWGFWDGRHWRPGCGLFRRDWSPRPALARWEELVLGRWRTPVEGRSDAAGMVRIAGHRGAWEAEAGDGAARCAFELGADGDPVLALP